jgi:hydrogenase nickel incorporation protein HypA/HybF
MHEIGIAADLTDIVLAAAGKENLCRVTKVSISIGRMVQIVPEIFDFAFREAVRGSVASDAELEIEMVEIGLKCRNCGSEFRPDENLCQCCACNSDDVEIIHGKELFIQSIEGE